MENLLVLTINVFLNLKSVMELMTVKTRKHLTKVIPYVQTTGRVREIISNVKILTFVSNPIGCAVRTVVLNLVQYFQTIILRTKQTAITIAATILMKTLSSVLRGRVPPIASDVRTIVVYPPPGIAMETMIVADLKQMNPKTIVRVKREPVLEICSLVIMETAFHAYISAMEIMTVSTTLMKTLDINVTLVSATPTENSPVRPTKIGVGLNVYPNDGFVMETPIVWMALMKTQLFTPVLLLSHVKPISSDAIIIAVLIRNGFAVRPLKTH